jgi:hypothetical protein
MFFLPRRLPHTLSFLMSVESESRDTVVHAHLVKREDAAVRQKRQANMLQCWKCLVGKSVSYVTGIEMKMKVMGGGDQAHDESLTWRECKCVLCVRRAVTKLVQETRDALFDLDDVMLRFEERLQSAYAMEDEKADEIFELQQMVASMSTAQLLAEEELEKKKATVKDVKKKKPRQRKGKKRDAGAAAPAAAHGSVRVFGDAPISGGGLFALLDEEEEEEVKEVKEVKEAKHVPEERVEQDATRQSAFVNLSASAVEWATRVGTHMLPGDAADADLDLDHCSALAYKVVNDVLDNDGRPFMVKF